MKWLTSRPSITGSCKTPTKITVSETINWETMKSNNTIQGDACLVNMHVVLQHEAMSSITRFEENKHLTSEWHWWVVEPRSDFHQLCRNDCNYFLLWKETYYFRLLKVNDALLNTKLSLELFEPPVSKL